MKNCHLEKIMQEKDENGETSLIMVSYSESFMEYLKFIELIFEKETIKKFLSEIHESHNLILYNLLMYGSPDSRRHSVEFYKKIFSIKEFNRMLKKVFEYVDENGNNLIHVVKINRKEKTKRTTCPNENLKSIFEVIKENIHSQK
jgi:heterodisulfide reductase subunit C